MSASPTTRRNWFILGGSLLLLLTVGAELLVRSWNSSKSCVQIVNQGESAIDDLVVVYGQTKVRVGRLGSGETTKVWFTAAEKGTVTSSSTSEATR